ncbi:hypothetical protein PC111_g13116 [Phytophthora cactorum]|nr:hypothetical protein PC111_g13116 [Phytophthora cactorum]KAG3153183.1 hypothetical protein C6341_g16035 [Phytophthora cactorum]
MTSVILKLARKMPRSPKNSIKSKIKAVKIVEAANTTVVAVAAAVGVDRSTIHRWRKNVDRLTTAARPNRQLVDPNVKAHTYVQQPQLEKRLLEWIVDMRKNRYLWVSTNCLLLMHSKFALVLFASRSRGASLMFIRRFLKRNRLTVRRITHKGRKKRSDMEAVANVFSHSILRTVEEDGILSFLNETEKYSSVYNMNQTAMYVDMNGRTTIDFIGASTVDVVQGSAVNCFRVSMFLEASATGAKLPPLIVYAGVPGGSVSQEVFNPIFWRGNRQAHGPEESLL